MYACIHACMHACFSAHYLLPITHHESWTTGHWPGGVPQGRADPYHHSLRITGQVERLKAELTQARSDEEHQRSQHRINVKKMLQANEALQAQLKELHPNPKPYPNPDPNEALQAS